MNIEPKSKKERAVKSRKRRRKTKTAMQKTKLQQQADSSQKLLRILKSMIQPTMWYKICTGKMTVSRAAKIIRLIILPITRSMRELSEPPVLVFMFSFNFSGQIPFRKVNRKDQDRRPVKILKWLIQQKLTHHKDIHIKKIYEENCFIDVFNFYYVPLNK